MGDACVAVDIVTYSRLQIKLRGQHDLSALSSQRRGTLISASAVPHCEEGWKKPPAQCKRSCKLIKLLEVRSPNGSDDLPADFFVSTTNSKRGAGVEGGRGWEEEGACDALSF